MDQPIMSAQNPDLQIVLYYLILTNLKPRPRPPNRALLFIFVASKDYGVPRFTGDAMEVITDPEVDAVWICSPSQYHAEQIKACAANGKDVFCEKPIATDLAETVEAINACNEAGVKLMIGLQRRFDPNFRRVKEAVNDGEVGKNIMVSWQAHN
jgi:predicted dehydrogenase